MNDEDILSANIDPTGKFTTNQDQKLHEENENSENVKDSTILSTDDNVTTYSSTNPSVNPYQDNIRCRVIKNTKDVKFVKNATHHTCNNRM